MVVGAILPREYNSCETPDAVSWRHGAATLEGGGHVEQRGIVTASVGPVGHILPTCLDGEWVILPWSSGGTLSDALHAAQRFGNRDRRHQVEGAPPTTLCSTGIAMGTNGRNPFINGDAGDANCNACVNNFMQLAELADCYVRSADSLVWAALQTRDLLDVHVYSVCFLYRHGIELILKDILWKSNFMVHGKKRICKGHRLGQLWSDVHANAERLLGSDYPLGADDTSQVRQLLRQIEDHDRESDAFRYPFDTWGNRTHQSLHHVNIKTLHEAVHRAIDCLLIIGCLVEFLYEQRSEGAAAHE